MNWSRSFSIVGALVGLIAVATVVFHFVENRGWVNAYFFSIVTLSMIGYGSIVPLTPLGNIETTVFIFAGLGLFTLSIQQLGEFTLLGCTLRRLDQSERRKGTNANAKSRDSK